MGRRTLLLITAILIAAVGTALLWVYVQGADQRATARQDTVEVYVTTRDLPDRLPGAQVPSYVEKRRVPRWLTDGAVANLRDLATLQAAGPITTYSVLKRSQFSTTGRRTGPLSFDSKKFLLTVQVANPQRVAYLIGGVQVSVFVTGTLGTGGPQTRLLLPDVTVVDVAGANVRSGVAGAPAANNVTLEVGQVEAQKIIQAQTAGGQLWLALKGADAVPHPNQVTGNHELFTSAAP